MASIIFNWKRVGAAVEADCGSSCGSRLWKQLWKQIVEAAVEADSGSSLWEQLVEASFHSYIHIHLKHLNLSLSY